MSQPSRQNKDEKNINAPNILWICTDQQRFDTLGCTGNSFIKTPNLDELARKGMMFSNCFTQSPVCSPSRGAFLTGRYPRTCRVRQNGQNIPPDERLVTKTLADNGYRCGLSGKLHISACSPDLNIDMEPRIDDGYTDFHWSHHNGGGWGNNNEYWKWLDERDSVFEMTPHKASEHIASGMSEDLSQAAWCTEKAIDFIQAHQKNNQPWLFSVNIFDPHHSFSPSAEALARFEPFVDELPLPNYVSGELDNKPIWQKIDHEGAYSGSAGFRYNDMTAKDHRWVKAAYWAMVENIDCQVGRILEVLEETGQRDNTFIIFTSDHGEMLGDHGIYLKGPYFYDCAVRVPLLISGPGIQPNLETDELIELIDIAPTILDIAGIPAEPGMQGKTIWPLLTGKTTKHRESVYCEFYGANFSYEPHAFTTMVRTDKYKLTVAHQQNSGELYDLVSDSDESVNLWDSTDYSEIKARMLILMTDRMAETCDPLPLRKAVW